MEEFKIIQPSPLLAPYIKNYWLLKTACDSPTLARTVPTGMMNLIFHRGNRLLSVHDNELHPRAFLSGHEKTFADLEYTGQINMIFVVFRPAGVKAFFDLPMHKINNLRVTANELGDKELAELEHSLTSIEDDPLCILLIEQFLLKRLSRLAEYNLKRIEATIHLINTGQTDVALLANTACLSTKQFQRIFSEYVGSNPKEFSRTIRFQRALHRLETCPQTSLTDLAYQCGYFDQSHMIKEFKALSGYTPSEYLETCPPHSDYFN
ncbi:AraC-like DNA-binding protein [Parabacteroides sp. PF5-5]|uniref:helix-turn-helix domain-containing protein n=1 Tax=unclassified Parabacteroides TaxID=2649774 RepID=UPI002473D8C6|nr:MULTISPECIES: helix-turn-helix domain-containing protein [unclassified Parabacteroides]MDH6303358.1 AraC-like DNA-binding protein [Parabacteroides sp. PH5-39]MDH6314681.1 AraC-like DNA-binding protein [Parabacteroides sp. PF5-13]MDH6318018.1 AraC-like DNA-binding protein [Parabacteroides sp. PH5-13]MDH6322051.1 AraC-like DNA-binding protein [Parabacteroides sp. PH5-8]MDH6326174.1 AraC-like DNA-binding protein [Parabacteroides sp. PH5-41]